MPTYDYRCTKCEHRFELFHGIKDDGLKRCPRCKAKSLRVPAGGAGLLFKGTGFYITDYRSKNYQEKARSEAGGGKTEKTGKSGTGTGGASGASGGSAKTPPAGGSGSGGKKSGGDG